MREELIGHWRAVRSGADLTKLAAVEAEPRELFFRDDGTAKVLAGRGAPHNTEEWEWYIVGENLVLSVPVDAVATVGSAEEKLPDINEQIVAVGEERLILDARPFGGEGVTIFQRVV